MFRPHKFGFFIFTAALILGAPVRATTVMDAEVLLSAPSGGVSAFIEYKLEHEGLKDQGALAAFYKSRDFKPYWVSSKGIKDRARYLIAFIGESWTHGLNPNVYHADKIGSLVGAMAPGSLAELDVLLSDAFLRVGQDLTGIRVDPAELKTDRSYWRQPLAASVLLSRLSDGGVKGVLSDLQPEGRTYNRLRDELRSIVTEDAPEYEAVLPIEIEAILRPGQSHSRVSDLRLRLGVDRETGFPDLYDDDLAAAIIQFQRKNGLKPDGYIGSQTLDVMNITRAQRIKQLVANLERLRWVSEDKPDKFVVVNIPSATLWAVEDNELAFEMPVIVGKKKRPTNMFITEITGVRFNPTWTVPYTIKREDIFPALQEDATYLAQKGMELISGRGENAMSIDPTSIDWLSMDVDDLSQFRMVQTPGVHNPLGRVRVLMPNRYNVYLHDTNERHYFKRASRALSSGCVRLENPEKMARFIMKERDGWTDDRMQDIYAEGDTQDWGLSRRIPVYLLYYTVWINERDELIYGHDLYGHDENLIKMLSKLDGIFIPVDNTGKERLLKPLAAN